MPNSPQRLAAVPVPVPVPESTTRTLPVNRLVLTRISHQLSSRGRRGAVPSGVCDLRGADSYSTVRGAPRGEKTPLGALHRRPQQKVGEICGLTLFMRSFSSLGQSSGTGTGTGTGTNRLWQWERLRLCHRPFGWDNCLVAIGAISDQIERPPLDLVEDPCQVLTHDSDHQKLDAAEEQN